MSEYDSIFIDEEVELLEGEEYYYETDDDEIPDTEEDLNMEVEEIGSDTPVPVEVLGMYDADCTPLLVNINGVLQEVAPLSPTLNTPRVIRPLDVVVHTSDDSRVDGDALLADQYEVAAEEPRRLARTLVERREGGRSQGVLRAGRQTSGSHWVRGEPLVEVYLNDDDLPEDLKERIMNVVPAREVSERASASASQSTLNEEVWIDEDDATDEALFGEEGISSQFEWNSMASFTGHRENFQQTQTGPVVPSANAYEAFRQYWDNGILEHIVTETNRYARGLASSSSSVTQEWYDTSIHEILVLFAFWMMLGVIQMPTIMSCFSNNPLMKTSIFRKMFSKSRYNSLCRALSFANNSEPKRGKIQSFSAILEHLNLKFKEAYVPAQEISIGESLTLWKRKLSIHQNILTKVGQFRLKAFEVCESSTGYLWSFLLNEDAHTCFDPTLPSLLKSPSSILQVIRPLLNKGYTVFMDNWFNSPLLARYLKHRKTDCVGTLCTNRTNVPPLLSLCNLKDGQFVARHSGDVVVMSYQDRKNKITTLSTYHGVEQDQIPPTSLREPLYKPQVILDYNKNMGYNDRENLTLETYLLNKKKYSKWNVRVFKFLLGRSIVNARIHREKSTGVTIKHLAFRLELVDQILTQHLEHVPKPVANRTDPVLPEPRRLHMAKLTDVFLASGRRSRRRCVWCIQQKAPGRTPFECGTCKVPLCLGRCFDKYHQKQ